MSVFSEKLTELRKAAQMSQGDVARRVGMSRQAISSLEADKNPPAWETVQLLARLFDVSLDVFADPAIALQDVQPKKPAGRPRKQQAPPTPPPVAAPEPPKKRGRKKG